MSFSHCVFHAENVLEAQMISGLLDQHGIDNQIDGALLTGGAGELQTGSVVRVMVAAESIQDAEKIVDDWHRNQPEEDVAKVGVKPKGRIIPSLFSFMLGIFLTASFIFFNSDTIDHDRNSDGEIDEEWVYFGDSQTKLLLDRNFDGKNDYKTFYRKHSGLAYRGHADNDFDGFFETHDKYKYNELVFTKSDSNKDGFYEIQFYYSGGVLTHYEFLNPFTEAVVKKVYYDGFRVTESHQDTDGDGTLDLITKYDELENPLSN
jgi:hypothetical protein